MYDGAYYGFSNVAAEYLVDYLIHANSYSSVAKPIITYIVYMYLY